MPLRTMLFLGSVVALALAACMPPQVGSIRASSGLRNRLEDADGWTASGATAVASFAGAVATVDLRGRDARVLLIVENPGRSVLRVKLSPQSGGDRTAALGEVRHQRIDGSALEGRSSYEPFLPAQSIELEAQQRAVFYVDCPLGREPVLGEYAVLVIEIEPRGGPMERRLLPLAAVYLSLRTQP